MDQAQEDLADIGQKGSTLEAYFNLNKDLKQREERQEVIYYYYWQVPEHYKRLVNGYVDKEIFL